MSNGVYVCGAELRGTVAAGARMLKWDHADGFTVSFSSISALGVYFHRSDDIVIPICEATSLRRARAIAEALDSYTEQTGAPV